MGGGVMDWLADHPGIAALLIISLWLLGGLLIGEPGMP